MTSSRNRAADATASQGGKPSRRPGRTWWLLLALVSVMGLVAVFYNLDGYRALTQHETFVAVPARAMLASGEFLVPDFAGLPRLQKPPLAYWLVAAASSVTGEVTPWTARLTSALAGLALAALVGWWASRWYGREVGLAAAAVQLSSVYLINFARQATIDMVLLLLCTAAFFLAAEHRPGEPRRRAFLRWTALYAVLALSVLAKVNFGPMTVLPVCFLCFVVQRRFGDLWHMFNPLGLLLLVASLVVWPYFVVQRVPEAWDVWYGQILGRAVGDLGEQPFWYYVPAVLAQLLPWTPFFIASLGESWRRAWREGDPREQFLWIWFLTPLLIINLSAFKHFHYAILSLPAASLLVGRSLTQLVDKYRRGVPLVTRGEAVVLLALFLGGAIGGGIGLAARYPYLATPALIMGIVTSLAGVISVGLLMLRRPTPAAVTLIAAFSCLVVVTNGWVFPARDRRIDLVHFARKVHREHPAPGSVCVFGLGQHEVNFFLDGSAYRLEEKTDLATELEREGRLLVVTDAAQAASLERLGALRVLREQEDLPDSPPSKDAPLLLVELSAPPASAHTASAPQATQER